ncbi:hypothetical protein AV530_012068 [Patagioenas fasciata monilis]|uniref:Uncharacterized protein n=1 Tax=Patagioenas fasciata monilis TaxID=372326 RepID=A0A1V4JW96_PATFA|nr:hypothetical protein AV530_012068 [Patagioenas fasciata monilis]
MPGTTSKQLTKWLPGVGTTEKLLDVDEPCHQVRSQPGIPTLLWSSSYTEAHLGWLEEGDKLEPCDTKYLAKTPFRD